MKKISYIFFGLLAACYRVGVYAKGNETCRSGIDFTDFHQRFTACRGFDLLVPKQGKVHNQAKTVVFLSDVHGESNLGNKLLACASAIAQQVPSESLLELTEDKLTLTKAKALKNWDDAKSCEHLVRLYVSHRQLIQLKIFEDAYYRAKAQAPASDKSFLFYLLHQTFAMENLKQAASNYPAVQNVQPIKTQLIDCYRRSSSFRYCFRTLRQALAQYAPLTSNKKNYQKLFEDNFHDLLWLIQIQPHNIIRNQALIQAIDRFIWSYQSVLFIYGGERHFSLEQRDQALELRFLKMQNETNESILNGKALGDDQLMLLRYHERLSQSASSSNVNFFLVSQSKDRESLSDHYSWVPYNQSDQTA